MSTIWIKKFGGVDARRLPETTASDSLIRGNDGHLTRGGEFEKRAAFVPTYTLPNQVVTGTAFRTFGLMATAESLYVASNEPEIFFNAFGMFFPAGVKLIQTANLGPDLTGVISWDLFADKLYSVGQFSDGSIAHNYDGNLVTRTATGSVAQVTIGSGTAGTINIVINGVSITGGPVATTVNPAADAATIAAAINSTISVPDYTAVVAVGTAIQITSVDTGTATNGRSVVVTLTGGAAANPLTQSMAGAIDGYRTGTRYVRTINLKMYTLSGQDLQFSSLQKPTDWDGHTGGVGFGFIDTSAYTAGSQDLTAIVEFRGAGAVFSQRTIQIWALASDPASNSLQQVLRNTGTSCPRSLTQFGDSDMFYLDENGLRSLRSTYSYLTIVASTYAVGVRIDPLIVAKLRSLTETERSMVTGLIEPLSGNFWLIMKDVIFVYSYYPEQGISGWTVYNPGFAITDAAVFNRRVYVRGGDTIYCYGGVATGLATDSTQAEAWTAYLDGGDDPTADKQWRSFDVAASGVWALSVGMDPANTSTFDNVATIAGTTYDGESIGAIGCSTHISLRFKSQGSGPAILGAFALHYDPA